MASLTKINFENKPSTSTPINASNLNQLQDNIDNVIESLNQEIDDKMVYFTEETKLNDLVIKSNLLGNNSKINASEIAVVNGDEVQTLDKYLDNINVYSTEEKNTGKVWIDNKSVYKKVVLFTSNNDVSIAENIDTFLEMRCLVKNSSGEWRLIPWVASSDGAYAFPKFAGSFFIAKDDSVWKAKFQIGTELADISNGIFIFEYTKTTD